MESWTTQLASIGGILLAAVLSFILATLRKKYADQKEKVLKPYMDKVISFLNADFLLPIFRNTYQTYTKKEKTAGTWTTEKWAIALNKTYESVMKQLPIYILNMAKKVFPNYEATIKERLENFYEANKNRINIDNVTDIEIKYEVL